MSTAAEGRGGRGSLAFALSLAETADGAAIQAFLIDPGGRAWPRGVQPAAATASNPIGQNEPLRWTNS